VCSTYELGEITNQYLAEIIKGAPHTEGDEDIVKGFNVLNNGIGQRTEKLHTLGCATTEGK
jgi:hypothetical protein